LDYTVADVEKAAGGSIALSDDKVTVLMGRMRQSSLSLHGIEGAFSGVGAKTVIPAKVSGKFSIRWGRLVYFPHHTLTALPFP
jgi:Cys-Gly metallodipeptidase DUG1